MKIDILSDLHIDFWFSPSRPPKMDETERLFLPLATRDGGDPGDILVVAGDLGHYNKQSVQLLENLRKLFGYRAILCVLGNHDYYLLGQDRTIYQNDSFTRVAEMRRLLGEMEDIHCLDGNVVEIDGVKFGGCDGWYDGEYAMRHFGMERSRVLGLWKHSMNDARYIHGMDDWMEFAEAQKERIEKIAGEVDVMVTHVNPSIDRSVVPKRWRDDEITAFFTFDGEGIMERGSMRYWIFGHTHDVMAYEKHGVKCLCNPLGYPGEGATGVMRVVI
ncbi:metallophosphoesterase [Hydrogenimonas cancrithermarum]|uniref:Phosphatase n=1 Tax=Hydrogenimonas cancrithermarum TaxID=2993563 RepID=A0ABN6WZW0_9BACT|nr:metallophosphoesterase [Hydrogenimonas cancrithermarum]BDY13995.1 phosphatase [Hydrogenimonas cancrithermarum]